jgi:uncharacterized protein YkwD
VSKNIFIPNVSVGDSKTFPCGLNQKSYELLLTLMRHPKQQRESLICDELLTKAAQAHAKEMATQDYFKHVSLDGRTSNERVREAGFTLDSIYSSEGNQVESIAGGTETAEETLQMLLGSETHRKHLLAEEDFFVAQKYIGVGYYETAPRESTYWFYWVILTAH